MRVLIGAGADIGAENAEGQTPLHGAAWSGDTEAVQGLVGAGADIHAVDEEGATPLHWAALKGHTETAMVLISVGADVNAGEERGTPLHWAALGGYTDAAEALVGAGADIDARTANGWTPLHMAAVMGHTEAVRGLVAAGADIHAVDAGGFTPSFLAATEEHQETERLLRDFAKSEGDEPPSEAGPPVHRPQPAAAPATTSYWVYEDKVNSYARIHEGTCSFCNHGEGLFGIRNQRENEWHGPYGSREEALQGAEATGRREVRRCGICRP